MLLWTIATLTCWALVVGAIYPSLFLDKINFKKGLESFRKDRTAGSVRPLSWGRSKRTTDHLITECIYMTSDEGQFYHKAGSVNRSACGVYIFTEPDQRVELHFNYLDVPCENGGLVTFLDGWELNGEFFPNPVDHPRPMAARFSEFCSQGRVKEIFTSSQNVAMLMYRMPARGTSFSFTVRYLKNPTPCNILVQSNEDIFTLRNYGKRTNCSISALFPAVVSVAALSVGIVPTNGRGMEMETGTIHKVRLQCHKRGLADYVQIGGSSGLDNTNLQLADAVCGLDSKPGNHVELIGCGTSTVRLISSGAYDNSVTVALRQMTEDDNSLYMSVFCLPDSFE